MLAFVTKIFSLTLNRFQLNYSIDCIMALRLHNHINYMLHCNKIGTQRL